MRTADQAGIRSLTIQKGQGFGSRRSLFSLSACNSYPVLDPGRLRPTGRLRQAGGILQPCRSAEALDRDVCFRRAEMGYSMTGWALIA